MVKLKYNVKGAEHDKNSSDQGGDRPLPPAAVYPARIAKCDYAEPEGKNPRLEVEIRLIDKEHKDYPLWEYVVWVNEKTDKETFDKNKWKADQFLQALGVDTTKKETGEFDTDEAVGKLIKVRLKHETDARDKQNIKTRARPGGMFYYDPDDDDSFEVDQDDVTGPFDDVDPDVNDGVAVESDESDENDWAEYPLADVGEAADGDDDSAIGFLTLLAGEHGLDPETIDTWTEVAEQVEAAQAAALEAAKAAKPAKKGAAKKAAAPAKKAAGKAAAAPKEATTEEYGDEWSLDDLKAELQSRQLPTRGPRTALVNRLKENDGDPFQGGE